MRIIWPNVAALLLFIFAVVIAIRQRAPIARFLATLGHLGPGQPDDERFIGFVALGVILVALVAIVKLLTRKN